MPRASLWVWAALSAGLPLALPFVARSLASQVGEGELATFNYAWKLVELPLVLAIQLVATLSFPAITRAFATSELGTGSTAASRGGEPNASLDSVVQGAFALAWALGCATAAALIVGAPAVASLLFGWGRMSEASVERIGMWGAVGAWSLLPQALIAVALTVLAVQSRMRAAVAAYAVALAALLMADAWTQGAGARLMWVLVGVLSGVAIASLVALGPQVRRWLPWRAMVAPLVMLLLLAGLARYFNAALQASGTAVGLAWAALAGLLVIASAWLSAPVLRQSLRR